MRSKRPGDSELMPTSSTSVPNTFGYRPVNDTREEFAFLKVQGPVRLRP
jgi:hypothetical protein